MKKGSLKKKINSKAKGAVGERELRDFLKGLGIDCRRTQQYSGTEGTSDVTVPAWSSVHIECKRVEQFQGYDWVAQAERDAGENLLPVVYWRKNGKKWLCIMDAERLTAILAYLELSKYRG